MPKRKIDDWAEILNKFSRYNGTVNEFCRSIGIHPNSYYKNRKKYQEQGSQLVRIMNKPDSIEFQPLIVQINGFSVKIPDLINERSLETTLRVLRNLI